MICSVIGPKLSAGKKVKAPTIKITPTSKATNKKLSVLNVPTDSGMIFLLARLPASAMTGKITPKRPISIAKPSRVFKMGVLAESPAKALPLFPAADVKA